MCFCTVKLTDFILKCVEFMILKFRALVQADKEKAEDESNKKATLPKVELKSIPKEETGILSLIIIFIKYLNKFRIFCDTTESKNSRN